MHSHSFISKKAGLKQFGHRAEDAVDVEIVKIPSFMYQCICIPYYYPTSRLSEVPETIFYCDLSSSPHLRTKRNFCTSLFNAKLYSLLVYCHLSFQCHFYIY